MSGVRFIIDSFWTAKAGGALEMTFWETFWGFLSELYLGGSRWSGLVCLLGFFVFVFVGVFVGFFW